MVMTGGAMANFVGLKCARDQRLGLEVREHGVREAGPVALYASEEAHVVIRRAADMLGLGAGAVRAIAIDDEQRMRPDALARRDRAPTARPASARSRVCATAGTTTTGSIDPLPELAAIAAEARRSGCTSTPPTAARSCCRDELRPLLAGIEHADSIAVDPHKWLYTPQSAGIVLLRDFGHLSRSFHADASYIWLDEAARHGVDFAMHGPQFSRGFAALKVWVSLLAHGRAAYGRADRARRRARPLPRRARRGAPGLRADVPAAALDLLLPLPPARLGRRRGGARPAQRAADDRDPRRRPRRTAPTP